MNEVLLKGLDKAAVLAALYNASKPQGMGFLEYDPKPMTVKEAREILADHTYFDYLKGRVMEIDLSGDSLYIGGYDRDNGQGAAEVVITHLRETGDVVADKSDNAYHQALVKNEIKRAREFIHKPTTFGVRGGFAVITLGGEDVADELGAVLDKAEEAL